MQLGSYDKKRYYGFVRELASRVLSKLQLTHADVIRMCSREPSQVKQLECLFADEVRRLSGGYPLAGDIFELSPRRLISPMALVAEAVGPVYASHWQFRGQLLVRKASSRFKLISVGECHGINEVLAKQGDQRCASGRWISAFHEQFPIGDGVVAIADPSWFSTGWDSGDYFPCLNWPHGLRFVNAQQRFPADWRWLVEVA